MAIIVLSESDLRRSVSMGDAGLAAIEHAFIWLVEGEVAIPPIIRIKVADNNGDVVIKSAYVRGVEGFVGKIASGFFNNPKLSLPSGSAMMVVTSLK